MVSNVTIAVLLALTTLAYSLKVCTKGDPQWELIFDGCNPTPLPCVQSKFLREAIKAGNFSLGGVRRCCGTYCRIEEIRPCPEEELPTPTDA